MKTFVINLPHATARRERVRTILAEHPSLDVEFIEAVDGRKLSAEEIEHRFDLRKGNFRAMCRMLPEEIGCTLSHQTCYRRMVAEGIPYALILEDDLTMPRTEGGGLSDAIELLKPHLDTDEPRAILLSNCNWWISARPLDEKRRLARVFDAWMTHAYPLNLAGARLLAEERPGYTADNWRLMIRRGLHLYSLLPHIFGQDRAVFGTFQIEKRDRRFGPLWERVWCRIRREPFKRLRKQLLEKMGHFEA